MEKCIRNMEKYIWKVYEKMKREIQKYIWEYYIYLTTTTNTVVHCRTTHIKNAVLSNRVQSCQQKIYIIHESHCKYNIIKLSNFKLSLLHLKAIFCSHFSNM